MKQKSKLSQVVLNFVLFIPGSYAKESSYEMTKDTVYRWVLKFVVRTLIVGHSSHGHIYRTYNPVPVWFMCQSVLL